MFFWFSLDQEIELQSTLSTDVKGFAKIWENYVHSRCVYNNFNVILYFNEILSEINFFSAPFEISLSRLEKGSWREVTDAGVLKLKCSLQAASDNSWKDLDDIENLRTGIKQDEYILVMPKNWVSSGIFFFISCLIV